ncbi:MAG: hypothetical protein ABL930_01290 [Pseudobdellovibrio sp.]
MTTQDKTKVIWSKRVDKQIHTLPVFIVKKFYAWVTMVSISGIRDTRRCVGLHDEQLKGARLGQRSIRLNNAYRAIYIEHTNKTLSILEVIEVNKHEY